MLRGWLGSGQVLILNINIFCSNINIHFIAYILHVSWPVEFVGGLGFEEKAARKVDFLRPDRSSLMQLKIELI